MKPKSVYLILIVIGSILPGLVLMPFFMEHGFSFELFMHAVFVNSVAAALATDLLISAVVFWIFSYLEIKRLRGNRRFLLILIPATLFVGLSCGLPLFLFFREGMLESKRSPQ